MILGCLGGLDLHSGLGPCVPPKPSLDPHLDPRIYQLGPLLVVLYPLMGPLGFIHLIDILTSHGSALDQKAFTTQEHITEH